MTINDLKNAWDKYIETGFAEIAAGVFLEAGRDIPRNADEEELIDDACYMTTDDGVDPIYIGGFDDLCDELKDNLED